MDIRVWLVLHVLAVLSTRTLLAAPPDISERRVGNGGLAGSHRGGKGPLNGAKGAKGSPARGAKGAKGRPPSEAGAREPPLRSKDGKGPRDAQSRFKGGKAPRGKFDPRAARAAKGVPSVVRGKGQTRGQAYPGKGRPQRPREGNAGKARPKNQMRPRFNETKRREYEQGQSLQFKFMDADGDEQLTEAEVLVAQANLTARHEQGDELTGWEANLEKRIARKAWMQNVDTDNNGRLTFEEFRFFKKPEDRQKDLAQKQEVQFKLMDADGDGQLTSEEASAMKKTLKAKYDSGEQLEGYEALLLRRIARDGWMQAVDADKDGWLTFDEFRFIKKPEPKPQEL